MQSGFFRLNLNNIIRDTMNQEIVQIQANGYIAKINLSRGANCISLRNEQYGAVILREPNYKKLDNPCVYGMPILYPNNRISGGCFTFENREYSFPINEPHLNNHIHGFLHETPFVLMAQGENYVVCEYKATKEKPYSTFPHEFLVRISYYLDENGLSCDMGIFNESNENMPNLLGFHTTFNLPFLTGGDALDVRVLTQVKDLVERNRQTHLPTGEISPDDEITNALCQGLFIPCGNTLSRQYFKKNKGKIALTDTKRKISVVYDVDEKFGYRLIYKDNTNEYLCIEPQTCIPNAPNSPFDRTFAGFDYISPKQSKNYHMQIYIKEELERE